jgi:membrane-associated phospholipid phosphatase
MVLLLRHIHRSSRGLQPAEQALDRGLNPAAAYEVLRWPVAAALGALLMLAGVANLYLGVHWPSDVLGGYLWGLVLLLPALAAYDSLRRPAA